MAFPAILRRIIIALNGYEGPEYYQAGDSLCKPGMIVMEDDADEVKVCTTSGKPIGVVGSDADHDLSTVYAAGERIPIYPLGCGVDIYVLCVDDTTIDVDKGVIIETADAETSFKGHGKVVEAFTALTTTHSHAATGERMWGAPAFWVGRALETADITSQVKRYVPVKLSL